jgi:hypothetical protein
MEPNGFKALNSVFFFWQPGGRFYDLKYGIDPSPQLAQIFRLLAVSEIATQGL